VGIWNLEPRTDVQSDLSGSGGGGMAGGGPVSAGQLYTVNELGTEMFRPNMDGVILTADQTRKAAQQGGGGGDIHVHFSGNVYGAGGRDAFVRQIAGDLRRLLKTNMAGASLS